MQYLIGAVVGFLVGCFAPGVARKVKALFVKEASKGSRLVEGEIRAAEADIKKKL